MKKLLLIGVIYLTCFGPAATRLCTAQEPLDGRHRVFHDEFLDKLIGEWKLTRKFDTRTVENTLSVEWVLNHQFLQLHMKDVDAKPTYEAMVFIGYDNSSERYVAHWIDVFGGRFSESLGYGTRAGNSIKFVFEYPDGPFLNTFTWRAETRTWTFLMQRKNAAGMWVRFAEDSWRRS
jgi:hypothetical protein